MASASSTSSFRDDKLIFSFLSFTMYSCGDNEELLALPCVRHPLRREINQLVYVFITASLASVMARKS